MAVFMHRKFIDLKVIIALLFLISTNSYSQISAEYEKYKEEHPNAHAVRLNQETVVSIKFDKGEFDIVQEVYEEDLFLDQSANYNSKQSLTFSEFYDLKDIEAYSLIPDGDEYRKIPVRDFKIKDELNESFHDGLKSVNFIYPNLEAGARTVLKYSKVVKNPRVLNSFFFGNRYPIDRGRFIIKADKDVQLQFEEINTEGFDFKFTASEGKRYNTYIWEIDEVPELEFEVQSPNFRKVVPHIIPIIRSYKLGEKQVQLLEDVSDLYRWYYSLVENLNTTESDQNLIDTVDELTAGKSNDIEKVRAIYYWTQENIKYIDFEYALDGFIPREANDVFKKKYGDCKDNSSILAKMLDITGCEGYLTWVGTRDIPYTYDQVPTPKVDNHMIMSYQQDGETFYMDATGRYLPLEMPSSFIQGKEALVGISKDSFCIKTIPIIPASVNALKEETDLYILDTRLNGNSTTAISGYKKVDLFYDLEEKTKESELKEYYNYLFRKGNNSFLISDFKEFNKYSYDQDFRVQYEFSIENHVQSIQDEMFINLNLNNNILKYKTEDDRKTSIEFDYNQFQDYEISFHIPDGYVLDYVPENFSLQDELIEISIAYEKHPDVLKYKHSFSTHFMFLDLEQQVKVNEMLDLVARRFKEVIVLKKI